MGIAEVTPARTGKLEDYLSSPQAEEVVSLRSPVEIQAYLDATPYSAEDANRCPLRVVQDRLAHCLDGALFAAAALRRLGHPPLLIDLLPEPGTDDDHLLAIFKHGGYYGAVAKSNFAGLRFREPVFRTYRELVLSYFESYFNIHRVKTLRGYSVPFNLATYDALGWEVNDEAANIIERRLYRLRRIPLVTPEMAAALTPVDGLTFEAGTLQINLAGVFKPQRPD